MRRIFLTLLALAALSACKEKGPVWAPVWKPATPLSIPRQGLAAVEVNGFIYAIGGAAGTVFLETTEYAKIQEDGSLGPWLPGPPMNEARGYFDAVVLDGSIYVIGGGKGKAGQDLLRSVERAKINPDGSLSPWTLEENGMVSPRRCSKVVLIDRTIYALGGFGGDMLNTVEHAAILEDGTTDEWYEEAEKLTEMRYISGVKKVRDFVVVAGSHDQRAGAALKDVEWSKVMDEAGFGKWQKTSPMAVERYGLALIARGDLLYAFGGLNGPKFLDSIEVASILPEGGVGPWKLLKSKMASTRAMMAMLVYKDRVYTIGGAGTDRVEYATFSKTGEIGSWVTPEELRAIEALRKQQEAKNVLPLGGKVVKILSAKPYVYLEVRSGAGGEEWVAGPEGDFSTGDSVRYAPGAMMVDFYSKQLGIKFERVRFVGEIEKVP